MDQLVFDIPHHFTLAPLSPYSFIALVISPPNVLPHSLSHTPTITTIHPHTFSLLILTLTPQIAPELVDTDSTGYKAVAYGRASVLVAEALKDLAAELRGELRGLRERLEYLELPECVRKGGTLHADTGTCFLG